MRLLLDTAILIWAVESPERLTKRATAALKTTDNVLEMSAVSLSEIAIKTARGKLRLSGTSARQALEDLDIRILPYTADHAFLFFELAAAHLQLFPADLQAGAKSGKHLFRPGLPRRSVGVELQHRATCYFIQLVPQQFQGTPVGHPDAAVGAN